MINMKKTYSLTLGILMAGAVHAQVNTWLPDSLLSRFTVDVNVRAGMLTTDLSAVNSNGNYLNAVNSNTGTLKFDNSMSLGGELQAGFFFGRRRHWGVGTGLNYYYQSADISLSGFHVEYQATDFKDNVYRQVITANKITETVKAANINIPLVLKYKYRFSKSCGFTADAGIVLNLQMNNAWNTNASFDYEAIYKFADATHTVYDNAVTPAAGDYLITRDNYLKDNPGGDVQAHFNDLHSKGYNVGLGVKPVANSGNVSYASGSIGFVFKPSFNLFLSERFALDLGAYYMYQSLSTNAPASYRIPEKMGDYNSLLNSVSAAKTQSYGLNLGVRVFFAKPRDRDHDGVIDRRDLCPDDSGSIWFQGCPDADGDSVIDKNDSCPKIKGIAKFFGCPDSDDDGIQDKDDACPFVKGLVQFHGCPDRDGDGIPDKDDNCPDIAGLAQFHGCPDKDGDGIPDNMDRCPDIAGTANNQGCPDVKVQDTITNVEIDAPILFDAGGNNIKKESMTGLAKLAEDLKTGKLSSITIAGHTDNTGSDAFNMRLSIKRANNVKRLLVSMGVDEKKIIIKGYGKTHPAASNKTRAGRMKNRRVELKLK